MDKFIDIFYPSDSAIRRRGEYLIEHADPLYVISEVVVKCIANKVNNMEPSRDEGTADAVKRFKIQQGYAMLLNDVMEWISKDLLPTVELLYDQQYPELEDDEFFKEE
jgi:hypothetical protein